MPGSFIQLPQADELPWQHKSLKGKTKHLIVLIQDSNPPNEKNQTSHCVIIFTHVSQIIYRCKLYFNSPYFNRKT